MSIKRTKRPRELLDERVPPEPLHLILIDLISIRAHIRDFGLSILCRGALSSPLQKRDSVLLYELLGRELGHDLDDGSVWEMVA